MADRREEIDLVADIITKAIFKVDYFWLFIVSFILVGRGRPLAETPQVRLRSNLIYAIPGNTLYGQRQGIQLLL